MANGGGRRVPARLQRGSAVIEYCIVALLAILVLVGSDEDVVRMVLDAIRSMYRAFTSALSITYPPL